MPSSSSIVTATITVVDDPSLTMLAWSPDFYTLFARIPAENSLQSASLLRYVPPNVIKCVQGLLHQNQPQSHGSTLFVREGKDSSTHAEIYISIVRMQGVSYKSYPVYHAVFTDLSGVAEVRRTTALEKRKYDIIADLTADIPFEYDFATDTMTYADKYRTIFGTSPRIPYFRRRLTQGASIDTVSDLFTSVVATMDIPVDKALECHARTKDGSTRWFSVCSMCIVDERDMPTKSIGVVRNIDRQKKEQLRLLDKASTDAMTGLRNKAATEEEIREALTEVGPGRMGVLMMLDVDNFKTVNDSMGHQAGDAVLIQLARQLVRTFRGDDIIGRVGGDEFHIFMKNIKDIGAAHEKANEICVAVREQFSQSELGHIVSVSVGATCAEEPIAYGELFRQADVALYRAKGNGKNRYEFFGSSAPVEQRTHRVGNTPTQGVARSGFILDIIDTLYSFPEMDAGIDKALEFIGHSLKLSSVVVYEESPSHKCISISHEWVADKAWARREQCQHVPLGELVLPKPKIAGGIYYCSNTEVLPPNQAPFHLEPEVKALLQCDIMHENKVIGHIRFEERNGPRIWTQQEIDAVILMARMISGHISQVQSVVMMKACNYSTINMLNALPATYVCVISAATWRLLYFNDRVRERCPHVPLGATCYELFEGCAEQYTNCLRGQNEGRTTYSTTLYDSPFGKVAQLSMTRIMWENQETAYVALIYPNEVGSKELEQKTRKDAYMRALQENFGDIYEIDTDEGTVQRIFSKTHMRAEDTAVESFESYVRNMAEKSLHPADKKAFYNQFSLENVRNIGTNKRFSQKYRLEGSKGEFFWVSSLLLPLTEEDGGKVLWLCQYITSSQHLEHDRQRMERRYNSLFRQSCSLLVEIDLQSEAYVLSTYNEGLPSLGVHKTYSALLEAYLPHVHPNERGHVWQARCIGKMREEFAASVNDDVLQYRLLINGEYQWQESQIFFINDSGDPSAFLLCRDINTRKKLEEAHTLEAQRFMLALRDTYTEMFELNLDTDIITPLFSNSATRLPLSAEGNTTALALFDAVVHPDDRAQVEASFAGNTLRQRFMDGCTEVAEEFRHLRLGGKYHWVSAVVVPLRDESGLSDKVMLMLKDISRRKEHEQQQRLHAQYNLALRNIYDELYECNVTRDSYSVVYHSAEKYVCPASQGALSTTIPLVAQDMIHPEDQARFLQFFDIAEVRTKFVQGQEYLLGEFRKLRFSGAFEWAALTMFPAYAGGEDEVYLVFVMDIHARKHAETLEQQNMLLAGQRSADERYKIIIDQTNTLVFEWSPESHTRYLSPELAERFAGTYDERDIMRVWREDHVIHPDDMSAFESFVDDSRTKDHLEMTVRFRKHDGTFIWCKVVLSCQRREDGAAQRFIGTLNDVHEATCSTLALHYRAEYDLLTGVNNMQTFYSRAAQLLREHVDREYSIIRMDVDDFKIINDLYGLQEGDSLLRAIAQCISERMNAHCVCGRISGDVFCMCVDYSDEEIAAFVRHMGDFLSQYPLSCTIVPSFGICHVDNRETPINVLCDWAHLALKTVKGNVLVYHAFYDDTLRERILEEKEIESTMHAALENGEFCLYLQPKVEIATEVVVGSEGLVRWAHPVRGLVQPDSFIPLFERNGFILRLDEYVWEQGCILLRRWLDEGRNPPPMSVNVSRMHIHDTRLCEKLRNLLQKYDLPLHMLELELTESVFLENDKTLIDTMQELRTQGFSFSLDDFGAGYSSLNMLKNLPIDTIKIDRGFLSQVSTTERGKTIIRHTIGLAKALHMNVVAEGVENADQAAFLLDAGCTVAQGYHYSRPVPVNVFEQMAFEKACPLPEKATKSTKK